MMSIDTEYDLIPLCSIYTKNTSYILNNCTLILKKIYLCESRNNEGGQVNTYFIRHHRAIASA